MEIFERVSRCNSNEVRAGMLLKVSEDRANIGQGLQRKFQKSCMNSKLHSGELAVQSTDRGSVSKAL